MANNAVPTMARTRLNMGSPHQTCIMSRSIPRPPAVTIIARPCLAGPRNRRARKAVRNTRNPISPTSMAPQPIRLFSTQNRPGTNTRSVCKPNRTVSAARPNSTQSGRVPNHLASVDASWFLVVALAFFCIVSPLTGTARAPRIDPYLRFRVPVSRLPVLVVLDTHDTAIVSNCQGFVLVRYISDTPSPLFCYPYRCTTGLWWGKVVRPLKVAWVGFGRG